ncbi:MAG: hypothetical protein D6B27_02585, partial [Gammaproteobacteria bacterium]
KSTRYDYRVIPLKDNNIGRYTDKNEIYARVGEVADISPAPEMSAANYIFEYEEGIYYLDHIGSGKVDQLRKFDVDGGEWSIIPISPFEFGASGNWASGVDEDSNKFYLCQGSRLVSLELGSKVWEETNVDGLNCATNNRLALYEGYLIAVNSNAIQIVDLETHVLVATMDYSGETTIFEKSLRVGDMLTVAFSLTNQSGERIGGLASVNLDELITAAINGQRKNFEILSEFSEDLCFAGSDFALATDGVDHIYYRGQTVEEGSCYSGSPVSLSFNLSSGEWSDHTYPKTMNNERAFVRRDFDMFCSDSRLFVMGGTTDLEGFGSASYEVLGEELDGVFLTWNYFPGAYRARLGGRSVVYQDQIIQVGGRGSVCSSKMGDCVESYDPATGAWVERASLNKGRWEGTSSFVYRDKIVAIGEAPVETYSPNSWEIDVEINSFELDENGKKTNQVLFPTTRTGSCAVNYGDDIYVFGGLAGVEWGADHEFRVEHFIGESNEWVFLDLSQNTLSSRQGHACRVYNGEIYLIGGNSVDNKPNSDIDVYNPETKQWRTLSAKAPFSQNLNADRDAAIYNDNIIFSNIVDFDNGDFGVNLVALHVPTGEIRVFSELPESGHGKRFGFSMASYKGATYLFGGSYGFMVSNVVSVVY